MKRALFLLALAGCTKPNHEAARTDAAAPPPRTTDILQPGDSGTIALEAPAGAAIADVNGDGVDDVVAHVRIKSLHDEQERVVALDGKSTALLWASRRLEPLPRTERPKGAWRTTRIAAGKVALADGWRELTLFDATSGAFSKTVLLPAVPGKPCTDDRANVVSYNLVAGSEVDSHPAGTAAVDLATAALTEAHCQSEDAGAAAHPDFAFESSGHPVVTRLDPATRRPLWRTDLPPARVNGYFEESKSADYTDISDAGVLVVIRRHQYLAQGSTRFVMLDREKGTILWDRDDDSAFEEPHVVGKNLVVAHGSSVDFWDPATGAVRRTFGPTMGELKGNTLIPK